MRPIGVLVMALLLLMVWVACGESDSAGDETQAPTTALSDDAAIRALMDEFAVAFADDDWGEVYDLASPNSQAGCSKDLFKATVRQVEDLAPLVVGDDWWSAFKSDARDGFRIADIEVQLDSATVVSNDFDADLHLAKSNGVWQLNPNAFCDALFGPWS